MERRDFLKSGVLASAALCAGGLGLAGLTEAQQTTDGNERIRLTFRTFDLQLRHTWTIARGSRNVATIILTDLACDGTHGFGEAALSTSARYGETRDTVLQFLSKVDLRHCRDLFEVEDVLEYVDRIAPGNYAAKASLDIAIHDWIGKKLGVPLYRLWGLNKEKTPLTSFSIAIDTPENMMRRAEEASEYPLLKIKVGRDNDRDIISSIRRVTQKPLRVDANEGWRSKEQALENIKWMEDQGVEFIEQPLPTSQLAETAWLRERVHMPIIADESVGRIHDIVQLKDAFDGINIKLMKCGGLAEAYKMIHAARALRMKVMMGCMIESSVGITAAAHLSPLIDYADLDGNILVGNDPYAGVQVVQGKLLLNDQPGLGVTPRPAEK